MSPQQTTWLERMLLLGVWIVSPLMAEPSLGSSDWARDRHVAARLLSEQSHVRAGDQWWVALELKHDPTWHTYWINGGDAGIPTTLQWDLPAGIEAGPIHWAPPQIVKMGQLDVYGYEGRCLLLIPFQAHASLGSQGPMTLHAKAHWMMCARTCMPGKGVDLELKLGLGVTNEATTPLPWLKELRKAVSDLPRKVEADGRFHLSYDIPSRLYRLRSNQEKLPSDAYFFDASGQLTSNQPQRLRHQKSGWILELPRANYASETVEGLKGFLRVTDGAASGSVRWLELELPLPQP